MLVPHVLFVRILIHKVIRSIKCRKRKIQSRVTRCRTFKLTPSLEVRRTAGLRISWSPKLRVKEKKKKEEARSRLSGNIRISSSTSPSASRVCLQRPDWKHRAGCKEELRARTDPLLYKTSLSSSLIHTHLNWNYI